MDEPKKIEVGDARVPPHDPVQSTSKPVPSALDRIENTLYDPKKKSDDFSMHQARDRIAKELPSSWGDTTPVLEPTTIQEKTSFGMWLLIGSLIVLLAALSFTAWRVLSSRNVVSSENIDIKLNIAPYVEGGEQAPLSVTVINNNGVPLEATALTLMYKKGNGAQDEEEKVNDRREEGSIVAHGQVVQDFTVAVFGSEAESRDISLKFEYKVPGSNATFSKVASVSVVLKTPPMSVSVDGPQTLSVGQSGVYAVTIKNNTSTSSLPSTLMLTLPNSFVIDSASPKPESRSTVWTVPSLDGGQMYTVSLNGSFNGTDGEVATMRAAVGSQGNSLTDLGVVYSTQTYDVKLRSSPLQVTAELDTERGASDSLRYGDVATLVLTYKNTSDQVIKNITLLTRISGEAVSQKDIQPDTGYYDSVHQTITWDPTTLSDSGSLQPHSERTVRVRMPIVLKGTNSPKLGLDITGTGTMIETNDVVTNITKSWAIQGSVTMSAQTHYRVSPFTNLGPIPPVANMDTTYTAHIVVSAQNALTNAKVSFSLPIFVTWRNTTSDQTRITYDPKTRLVTWIPGDIEAGKTATADIGVTVRPSLSHVNLSPSITSGIVLDATEVISRASIRTTISPLTTQINGESWPRDPSRVVDK